MAGLPLLTTDDVEGRLGRTLTAGETTRLQLVIDDVTAVITARLENDLTNGTDASETFNYHDSAWIVLDKWPVTIASVTGDGETITPDLTDERNGWIRVNTRYSTVVVEYDWGFDPAPSALKAVAAQIAGRAFGRPSELAGITSETTGPYNFQIGGAAASGPAGMLSAEAAVVDGLRRQLPYGAVGTAQLRSWIG